MVTRRARAGIQAAHPAETGVSRAARMRTGREAPGLTEIITRRREWPRRGARRTTLTPLTVVPASAPRQVAEGRRQG